MTSFDTWETDSAAPSPPAAPESASSSAVAADRLTWRQAISSLLSWPLDAFRAFFGPLDAEIVEDVRLDALCDICGPVVLNKFGFCPNAASSRRDLHRILRREI